MICHQKYLKFVENGDFEGLSDCYRNDNSTIKDQENPLNEFEMCKLVSSRKKEYYTFIYDPQPIIDKLKELEATEYLNNLTKTFDLTKRKNCCNCISLMLYALNNNLLYVYLPAICKTIENVYNNLPGWLVRIYMDPSVYEIMELTKERMKNKKQRDEYETALNMFNAILSAENVEIYTYFCKSIINKEEKIERTRFFRFLSFVDHTVNLCAIREADGIVSNLDCHNLKIFSQNDSIFYLMPVDLVFNKQEFTHIGNGYNTWTELYKTEIDNDIKNELILVNF